MNMPKVAKVETMDCGLEALDFLFSSMMIDECWSTHDERAFQWWGQGTAQSARAEPPREYMGETVSLLHVETDFLRNVIETEKTYEELDRLQMISALSAFIYLPSEGKIRMHSAVYIHGGNYGWISRLLLNVAGTQLLTAMGAGGFAQFFEGSEPDITPHPLSGFRETPDELVRDMGELYGAAGKAPVKVTQKGFEEVCGMLKKCSVLAFADKAGLGAEFHFVGDDPAVLRQMEGKQGVATSLYAARVDVKHRVFGHGLTSLMTLPAGKPPMEGHRWCNSMNLLESRQWTGFHMLGAWLSTPNDDGNLILGHRCFLPAFPPTPELIFNLAMVDGLRSKWASSRLGEGE